MRSRIERSFTDTALTPYRHCPVDVVNAMSDPSGDHAEFDFCAGSEVNCCGAPPSADTVQVWLDPERSDKNARVFPSGDQIGCQSFPAPVVTCRATPPATGITQMPPPRQIAIVLPSGDTAGSRAPAAAELC
jgi:hypothetical protein